MSIYSDLNALHDNDRVSFEVLINRTANELDVREDIKFENIKFNTVETVWGQNTLIFGERAVQEKYFNGGGVTHVESALYYILDKDGHLLADEQSLEDGMQAMKQIVDDKYS